MWRNPKSEVVRSCAIITTSANESLSPIHDRMPVILPRDLEPLWLDHDIQDYASLAGILTPYTTNEMALYPESTEGGRRVSVLKRQEGAPVNLG